MEQIYSFLATLKRTYDQQGQVGKMFLLASGLLSSCCLCSVLIGLASSRGVSNQIPSPVVFPSIEIGATPTALFNFGTVTYAPFPTYPSATALPTLTPAPTETQTPTQILPTATTTALPLPTLTNTPIVTSGSVQIVAVNKAMEYVDLQNVGNVPVDLTGWRLVSETGNQSCTLRGVVGLNEVLRVWARKGNPGFSCKFAINIWNDTQSDPAVLYNAQGQEVSRYP